MISALKLKNFDEESRPAAVPREEVYSASEVRAMLRAAHEKGQEAGFEDGRAAGLEEARQSDLARQSATLDALTADLARLAAEAEAHRTALEAQVVDFALSVCDKVFPELTDKLATERAAANVRRGLKMAIGSTRIRITLSEASLAALEPEIRERAAYYKCDQALALGSAPGMQDGEVRMEWDRGSLEHAFEYTCAQILNELRQVHAKVMEDQKMRTPNGRA